MKKVIVYSEGPFTCSVCACKKLTIEEVKAELNKINHPGTINGWRPSEEKTFAQGAPNPCDCDTYPADRKHHLFNC